MEMDIVYRTDTHELGSWERGTLSPHQCTTGFAERIGHGPAGCWPLALTPSGEIIRSSSVMDGIFSNGKIGSKHAVAHLSTIGAITQEERVFYQDVAIVLDGERGPGRTTGTLLHWLVFLAYCSLRNSKIE